ncbi:uncharacterized protein LOC114740035 [Neltuma alba]|uniref:uncharacterized protein LOC114740035 n=1 Tax=Neltuma alba TaxID=207710 RepID=UPI0010A494E7|nr:uncharacterized protein LOC114740035 [Prosopis alba]
MITGSNVLIINEVKSFLHKKFKIKDLGPLKYFLGLEVLRYEHGIILSQRKYASEIVDQTGLDEGQAVTTPMEQNLKLTAQETRDDHYIEDFGVYRRLVGKLLYLTLTRPDISFTVQVLSQFIQEPKESHLKAALRLVKYIKDSPGRGIHLSSHGSFDLECFCDSDHGSCTDSRRSVTGFLIKFGGSLVCWKCKKQSTVSISSAEAEYRALRMAAAEITWLVGLIKELQVHGVEPVKVHCDSQSAIHIASNPVFHERTKHIEIDCHFVREKLLAGMIIFRHVRSEEQLADILTKALGGPQHEYILSKLGTCEYRVPNLRGGVKHIHCCDLIG